MLSFLALKRHRGTPESGAPLPSGTTGRLPLRPPLGRLRLSRMVLGGEVSVDGTAWGLGVGAPPPPPLGPRVHTPAAPSWPTERPPKLHWGDGRGSGSLVVKMAKGRRAVGQPKRHARQVPHPATMPKLVRLGPWQLWAPGPLAPPMRLESKAQRCRCPGPGAAPGGPSGVMGRRDQPEQTQQSESEHRSNPLFIGLLQPHERRRCSIFYCCCTCSGSRAAGIFDKWIERFV